MIGARVTPVTRDYAFIVTKPLQLMFATSIIRQLEIAERSVLIITDDFKDAIGVYERLRLLESDLSLVDIRFCSDRNKAEMFATELDIETLFVDSDVGFKRFLILLKTQIRKRRLKIWVYEEGHGTYRSDMYQNHAKRRFFEFLGIGTHFGGSRFTRGIYLRDPELFIERFHFSAIDIRRIEHTPSEILRHNLETWVRIFDYSPVKPGQADDCAIYLTDWRVREEGLAQLHNFRGRRFVKPHPHIKTPPHVHGTENISATAPAELVLIDLLEKHSRTTVFHHGSSCERYVIDERLSYVRL